VAKFDGQIPVYQQIMQNVKADIVTGKLKAGDKLPSIREFSEKLMVNPNTLQRVFMELEREGVVYSQRGIGNFVSDAPKLMESLKATQAEKYALRFTGEMHGLGMSKSEVINLVSKFMGEWENDDTKG
jgi:GntR family transcriptional regulator